MNETPTLKELFLSFFKLGWTAFGGPAMIVYIRKMVVDKRQWLDDSTFSAGIALCQMIPGATAMQVATYTGLRLSGIGGAALCFIGFTLPAFLVMLVLSILYQYTQTIPAIISSFKGLQVMVVSIVAHATFMFGKNWLKSLNGVIIGMIAAAMFGFGIHPILVILLAAGFGLVVNGKQTISHGGSVSEKKPANLKFFILALLLIVITFVVLFLMQRRWFDLAFLMARIDMFAFGGGFSALPLMFNEVVYRKAWMDSATFLNGIALGQITPGPIVITATFIGYIREGIAGSIIATIFIFLPSFLMVIMTVPYYDKLKNLLWANRVLQGILYSFVGLLLSVTVRFALNISWDIPRIILAIGAFAALLFKVELPLIVLIGSVISALLL